MKQSISFTLNGKPVTVEVEGNESLLTVIREYLDKTGTKFGCGLGDCGACTVVINNEALRSCMLAVEDVVNKTILTIEGLEENGNLHPLQKAFVEKDALQCGFCTPGMIMNAYGLLLKNPTPTRNEVINGMEENLCRCGSYNRIVEAIQLAGIEMNKNF
ncbi:carbon-monoxide dehydrogenase small subunit [Lutibacter agarilyticus]|uniref:Carbon-monoxide dehydrogenase small subunit n=1 Tax=Lutibacter agarilyticus TaxID=1109740 RepID=A0A238W175_9FLAO|nr:(2Fe-2S)-binding protein [Lutibacter agarilyticus]SNR40310.1 carbon-monoxide dehydrogenase small subunit [Lutibacter agarilyticus]